MLAVYKVGLVMVLKVTTIDAVSSLALVLGTLIAVSLGLLMLMLAASCDLEVLKVAMLLDSDCDDRVEGDTVETLDNGLGGLRLPRLEIIPEELAVALLDVAGLEIDTGTV